MTMATAETDAGLRSQSQLGYWEARKHMLYYQAIFQYMSVIARDANSVIDIGSGSARYLDWFTWIPERTVLDFAHKGQRPGITTIAADFTTFHPPQAYDVALCLQVLEHVTDPTQFCDRLKAVARRVLISVPYRWAGGAPGHINDPVDEEKLMGWMKLRPNDSQIVKEPFMESRLIAYYDIEKGPKERFAKDYILDALREKATAL